MEIQNIDVLIMIICFRKFELFVEFAMSLKNWLSIADTGCSCRYQRRERSVIIATMQEFKSDLTMTSPRQHPAMEQNTTVGTVKILKFGTPQKMAIIVLKIEKFDVTLQ